MNIEEAIARLEDGIRRLKIDYDVFFAGGSRRPPLELRAQLDRLIKQSGNAPGSRTVERFHLNTVVGRYNAYADLWDRQQRALEEGGGSVEAPRPGVPPGRQVPRGHERRAPRSSAHAAGGGATTGILHTARITDPAGEPESLRQLFARYVAARTEREAAPPNLTLDSFVRQITRQVESLKVARGCEAIEFLITANESLVNLKARPASPVTARPATQPAKAEAGTIDGSSKEDMEELRR